MMHVNYGNTYIYLWYVYIMLVPKGWVMLACFANRQYIEKRYEKESFQLLLLLF